MGKETSIGWTATVAPDGTRSPGATFNVWHGCTRVDPACDHCYAESFARRTGWDIWGTDAPRRFFGERYWNQLRHWNEAAAREGVRKRVFCSSMADVFEVVRPGASQSLLPDRKDGLKEDTCLQMQRARAMLWRIIPATPWLDYLLLTKRADQIKRMVPPAWMELGFPHNVWMGVTIAEPSGYWRWWELAKLPAVVRFISYEPSLQPISIREMMLSGKDRTTYHVKPSWLIIGGESGARSRPFYIDTMLRPLIDETRTLNIALYVKQMGDAPYIGGTLVQLGPMGKKPDLWPAGTYIQEFPR